MLKLLSASLLFPVVCVFFHVPPLVDLRRVSVLRALKEGPGGLLGID